MNTAAPHITMTMPRRMPTTSCRKKLAISSAPAEGLCNGKNPPTTHQPISSSAIYAMPHQAPNRWVFRITVSCMGRLLFDQNLTEIRRPMMRGMEDGQDSRRGVHHVWNCLQARRCDCVVAGFEIWVPGNRIAFTGLEIRLQVDHRPNAGPPFDGQHPAGDVRLQMAGNGLAARVPVVFDLEERLVAYFVEIAAPPCGVAAH